MELLKFQCKLVTKSQSQLLPGFPISFQSLNLHPLDACSANSFERHGTCTSCPHLNLLHVTISLHSGSFSTSRVYLEHTSGLIECNPHLYVYTVSTFCEHTGAGLCFLAWHSTLTVCLHGSSRSTWALHSGSLFLRSSSCKRPLHVT